MRNKYDGSILMTGYIIRLLVDLLIYVYLVLNNNYLKQIPTNFKDKVF